MHSPDRAYPPCRRVRRRREYLAIQGGGRRIYSKHFVILFQESAGKESRLGITVSRKVEKRATRRNAVRRRVREAFRHFREQLVGNLDLVVIARAGAEECDGKQVRGELVRALRYHKLIVA